MLKNKGKTNFLIFIKSYKENSYSLLTFGILDSTPQQFWLSFVVKVWSKSVTIYNLSRLKDKFVFILSPILIILNYFFHM